MDPIESKYRNEFGGPHTTHRGFLHWPGRHGIPYRSKTGNTPILTAAELKRLPNVADFYTHTFRLWIPAEHEYYCDVRSRAVAKWYHIGHIERVRNPDQDEMSVYLEWYQVYVDYP